MARRINTVYTCEMCGRKVELSGDAPLPLNWDVVKTTKTTLGTHNGEPITRRIVEAREVCGKCYAKYEMVMESLFGGELNE